MSRSDKKLIVIVGPTAVGKTDLAFDLAKKLSTEIVSADSRQFYRELEIGTAKPEPFMLEEVKHHFVNSLSIAEEYTAGQFERDALTVLADVFKKRDVAIMVGGSGLYVQAVCDGMDEMPVIKEGVREKWNANVAENGLSEVRKFVEEHDHEFFQEVDKNNPVRLVRAAEVIESTGKAFSSFRARQSKSERRFSTIKIGLTAERQQLYDRINLRMDQMIANSLFEEATAFFGSRHLQSLQTLGYQEVFGYLEGKYDKAEAIRLLKRNSRRYAKRQLTWFRKDAEVQWFDRLATAEVYKMLRENGLNV
ncbi:MAG: tRNA (adenosine(37)-N6)-dimethylallyltransferase MiaA [Imperialibacter sp.]|uniref:tRNA (adenosine(37)-N6)-dimethylallyltransferase MiaA n=1 Tax=Imperialibacter sp. TaxID=2038411 RepID=UPI0032F00CAB